MPKYLFRSRYSSEGVRGLLQEGGTKRREATEQAIASVGGTLESFYFAFGGTDVFIIADLPDNVAAAALGLVSAATGMVSDETTVLLTAEDVDQVSKRGAAYRAPGA